MNKMNDESRINLTNKLIDFMENLQETIEKAGGTPDSFKYEKLIKMSAFDFISILALNNIRFIYIKGE